MCSDRLQFSQPLIAAIPIHRWQFSIAPRYGGRLAMVLLAPIDATMANLEQLGRRGHCVEYNERLIPADETKSWYIFVFNNIITEI